MNLLRLPIEELQKGMATGMQGFGRQSIVNAPLLDITVAFWQQLSRKAYVAERPLSALHARPAAASLA